MDTVKKYISLTKPHVMLANAITSAAGFFLASGNFGFFNFWRFVALFIGSTFVIASACVLNNYLDRDIDAKMERTKKRAMVQGTVSGKGAVIFSLLLLVSGTLILAVYTNWLVVVVGLIGFVDYVWLYGALSKRRSVHGTLVGSISGAIPILAGYLAVSGRIDAGAILLFAILFFWQMPEFYSISIYRRDEYKAASVPVISVVKGIKNTKNQIFFYTLAFAVAVVLLGLLGYGGLIYLTIMSLASLYWLWIGYRGLNTADDNLWARQMFKFSLRILMLFCFLISVNGFLP